MYVEKLYISNFRNIKECFLEPINGVNVISGQNAQGKTNLLEAIWLFTGAKSFRKAKDLQMINFDNEVADLKLIFSADKREQNSRIILSKTEKKKIFLNEIEKKSAAALVGNFTAVVFSPVHLNLVSGSPAERRRFLDTAICQLYPSYVKLIQDYQKILVQRNVLFKDLKYHSELYDTIENWDIKLAEIGAHIFIRRKEFIDNLKIEAEHVYKGISDSREKLDIAYHSVFCSDEIMFSDENLLEKVKNTYLELLRKTRQQDIYSGSTSIGCHRDDILMTLDGNSAKEYGSQGQQRSVALSLKLSECEILAKAYKEPPVVLLDDVMSELDEQRQKYILENIKDRQIFITCCDESLFSDSPNCLFFKAENGVFVKR